MKQETNVTKRIELCTGCGACALVCQHGAITINLADTGFYTAYVDSDKCVSCDLCNKVCIENEQDPNMLLLSEGTLYSAQSKDPNTLKTCTSGGISHELALYALDNEYLVSGVIYDYKSDRAMSIVVSDSKDLERIKGSKYLQSYTVDAYKELIQTAKKDPSKKFLVFGTPCQIYGLSKVLKLYSLRDRFVLVDLFCHGVPSYLVWNSYLNTVKKRLKTDKVTKVVFRDKSKGWHNFIMSLSCSTGSMSCRSGRDLFYGAFFDNVLLSGSCMNCLLRQRYSLSDIRLGDFWGARYQNREDGVSGVMVFTQLGNQLLHYVQGIEILDKVSAQEYLHCQCIEEYKIKDQHKDAIKYLEQTKNLSQTIRLYRKKFTVRTKLLLSAKMIASYFPYSMYSKLKKIINRSKQ
jgi:coenzyme F420-reducing hydrogenase beta subunit